MQPKNHISPSSEPRPAPPPSQPAESNNICSECGAFGASDYGGVMLCEKCYSEKGSCCPEFGKDDLWRKRDV